MSWLSELANGLGNVFGYQGVGDSIADYIDPDTVTTVVKGLGQNGSQKNPSVWSSPDTWSAILNGATGLAGSYMKASSDKSLAEQYAKAKQEELIANKLRDDQDRALKERIANKEALASQRNTLASLYNNWATNTQRGGEAAGQSAQNIGSNIGSALAPRKR